MFFVIGIVTGLLGGMGVGGGAALIPLAHWISDIGQHSVQGLNLLAFIPSSTSATAVYAREGRLKAGLLVRFSSCAIAGALLGAWIVTMVEPGLLKKVFGVFLLLTGAWQWIGAERKHWKEKHKTT